MFANKKRVIGAALAVALGLSSALTAVPAMASEKVITIWADERRGPNLIKAIGTLAQQTRGTWAQGYKVKVVSYPSFDALKEAFDNSTATTGPDIILGANDWVAQFAKSGKIAPIALATSVRAQYSASAIADMSFRGKLYGVPMDINNVAMIYNDKLITRAPRTFGEMVDYYKANKKSKNLTSGLCVASGGMAFGGQIVLSALGGGPYRVSNGRVVTTGDAFNPATLASNIERLLLNSKGKSNGFLPGTDAGCRDAFFAGKVPFAVIGNWEWRDFQAKGFNMSTLMSVPGVTAGTYGASFGSVTGAFLTTYAKVNKRDVGAKQVLTKLFAEAAGAAKWVKTEQRGPANAQVAATASTAAKGFSRAAAQNSIPLIGSIVGNNAGGASYWEASGSFWSNVLIDGKPVRAEARKMNDIFKKNIAAGK